MKGFVFVQGGEIALRYIKTNAFDEIDKRHELTYVALRSGNSKDDSGLDSGIDWLNKKIEWIGYYRERSKRWKELFDVTCIVHQDKSPSFAVRNVEQRKSWQEKYKRLEDLAKPGVYERYKRDLENRLGPHPDILTLALRERPDFFILPSTMIDRMFYDVMQVADFLKIPTLFLTAGWDNLSSKGFLQRYPTMIAVWGEQTRNHAIDVQGIPEERIAIIGAPHYDNYKPCIDDDRGEIQKSLGLPNDGKLLIMFAGTLRLFDETAALLDLEQAIESGKLPSATILYRPHPDRVPRENEASYFNYDWKHVVMDPEMADFYDAHKKGETLVPDSYLDRIDYLIRIYKAVDAVISPMSSILLESMLFGVPMMAVAFGDGKHSWSADKVSRMLHFKELFETPHVHVCRDRNDFLPTVISLIGEIGDARVRESLHASSNYFVYQEERTYSERVGRITDVMLSNATDSPRYDSWIIRLYPLLLELQRLKRVYATADLPVRILRRMFREMRNILGGAK